MFLGVSKNIGGFRIGVGTRIKGPTSKELKTAEFTAFMEKVQIEFNTAIATLIEANGHNFNDLRNENVDLDEVFAGNEDYNEFMSLFESAKLKIDKVLFSGDSGVVAKRTITDEVFKIKEFINKTYPGFSPSSANTVSTNKRRVGIILGFGIFFMPFIFSWFTLRKGHTKVARLVAFSWLILFLAIGSTQDQAANNTDSAQENVSSIEETPTIN